MKGKYNKLFLIGNGFDRWQGLPTSYDEFKKYYREHIGTLVKGLGIKTKIVDGQLITPVEMIYGDIFHPNKLQDEFFWTLESSMSMLDDQSINLYFGKTDRDLYNMQEAVMQAKDILQRIFAEWIQSIRIDKCDSGYSFDNQCYFINFNYTDTLEKRFGVNRDNDYHIHGDVEDADTIIVGHTSHPEIAFSELMEQKMIKTLDGGKSKRLRGLYLIEDALYETDKHIQDNIDDLCEFMTLDGLHIEDITDIFALGHSFAEVDYEYFDFLVRATQKDTDLNTLSCLYKAQKEWGDFSDEKESDEQLNELFNWIRLNIIYAQEHRKRVLGKENISFPIHEMAEKVVFGRTNVFTDGEGNVHGIEEVTGEAEKAVQKRFVLEQAGRTREVMGELGQLKGLSEYPADILSVLSLADYIDGVHDKRVVDARWHVSYFSEDDKKRAIDVLERTGCKNYELHNGIDECIEKFRK